MARRSYPKISKGSDGQWHAWVTVGTKPNGQPDRRHVKRESREAVEDRVDELLEQRRTHSVVKAGRGMTVEQWLTIYLDTVAPGRCDPSTISDYRSKCRVWVFPAFGKTRVDQLGPEQLEALYLKMARAGRAPSFVLKTHRILTRALEIARRRKLVPVNVAKLIDSPSAPKVEQEALALPEAVAVIEYARERRNGARWPAGLALGLRQGEVLGLRWDFLDLESEEEAEMRVFWQLRRRSFEHGCNPPCGRRRGGNCPDRHLDVRLDRGEIHLEGAYILKPPKGTGRRKVHVPPEIRAELLVHKFRQDTEKALAGDHYVDHGLVFARPDGRPVDPADDYQEWRDLLDALQIPATRLHNGRHTAATILLALGNDIPTVQEILGHADIRTTRGYVHVASEMSKAATKSIGSAMLPKRIAP